MSINYKLHTKEYITSGILESYAAGQLSKENSYEVELRIRQDPDIKSEYEMIQQSLYFTAIANLKSPSDKIKDSLLNKIRLSDTNKDPMVSFNKKNNTYRYMLAACLVLFMVSLIANYFLWVKLNDAKFQIAVLSDQKKLIIQEYESVNRKLGLAAADMEVLKDRSYKMIDLKGLERSPYSHALAFWNPVTKKVYIGVMDLPVPPPDKQYQLWAVSNGKPVDAGVMDVDPSDKSLHEMKSMEDAQAFCITLEPKGGSVYPTMNQMYVMGEV